MATTLALWKKTRWDIANALRIVRSQSSFKWIFVLSFAVFFELGLCLFFVDGFRFLDSCGGVGIMIISRLFSLFFLGMGLMLTVSGLVTSYSTIFRSEEIPFLLTRPFGMSQIVSYKFLDATALSSWAFFFIVLPFVASFAWYEKVHPLFAVWTLIFSIPFLLTCSGIGACLMLLIVRWFPRKTFMKAGAVALTAVVGLAVWMTMRGAYRATEIGAQFNIAALVPGLKLASNALLPSWWIAEGIMALARGQWMRGGMLAAVSLSTALFVFMLVEWLGGRVFYDGWQRLCESRQAGVRRSAALFQPLERSLRSLPGDVRAVFMKDVRTFFRDPVQWSQALIFFGLLALYFANLRSFKYHAFPREWRNIMAFMNVFSVSAVMCSLGSRFIYPQLSLEGQGFWILGLSPTTSTRILLTKFAVALVGMIVVGVALVFLSSWMLNVPWSARWVAVGLIGAVSISVSGLSSGLGAIFLDLRQRNPAAIVSGFGGTLNLVFCLAFMMAAILPFAFVFHMHSMLRFRLDQLYRGIAWLGLWLAFITSLATVLPLWFGARSLRGRDY